MRNEIDALNNLLTQSADALNSLSNKVSLLWNLKYNRPYGQYIFSFLLLASGREDGKEQDYETVGRNEGKHA